MGGHKCGRGYSGAAQAYTLYTRNAILPMTPRYAVPMSG